MSMIVKLLGDTIAQKGAEALILSLSTFDEIEESQVADKKWYVHARNRILSKLKKQTDDSTMLQHIATIETFFEELGKEEKEHKELGYFEPIQKTIESSIVDSIVKSIDNKNESDEAIRDAIIKKTREIAPETVIKRMKALFERLKT